MSNVIDLVEKIQYLFSDDVPLQSFIFDNFI